MCLIGLTCIGMTLLLPLLSLYKKRGFQVSSNEIKKRMNNAFLLSLLLNFGSARVWRNDDYGLYSRGGFGYEPPFYESEGKALKFDVFGLFDDY